MGLFHIWGLVVISATTCDCSHLVYFLVVTTLMVSVYNSPIKCHSKSVPVYPIRNVQLLLSDCHVFTDDQTRVRLMPYEGIDGSDYVNANFIDVS